MRILSRTEELILLCVWRLGEEAYCVPIMEEAKKHTGKKWTLSGIYIPLGRLEKKGYLDSFFGDPTPQRGGKSKRFYRITQKGFQALSDIKELERKMWEGLSNIPLD